MKYARLCFRCIYPTSFVSQQLLSNENYPLINHTRNLDATVISNRLKGLYKKL